MSRNDLSSFADTLLYDWVEPVTLVKKITTNDGAGGYKTEYLETASFDAAIVLDDSKLSQIAAVQTARGQYTVTFPIDLPLEFHDIIKRESDGQYFRLTSKPNRTPATASMQCSVSSAEEWRIDEVD